MILPTLALAVVLLEPVSMASAPPLPRTKIELASSRLFDLHAFVRSTIDSTVRTPKGKSYSKALTSARKLHEALGGNGEESWREFETLALQCHDTKTLKALLKGNESFPKKETTNYIKALASLEKSHAKKRGAKGLKRVVAIREEIEEKFLNPRKNKTCLAYLMRGLGLSDPGLTVTVYLVPWAPGKGVFHRKMDGALACIVGVGQRDFSTVCELILHETLHLLDEATSDKRTVLVELRDLLSRAHIEKEEPIYDQVIHTLIYVHGAATVKRVLDSAHTPLGELEGYYAEARIAHQSIEPYWDPYLEAKIDRKTLLTKVVSSVIDKS